MNARSFTLSLLAFFFTFAAAQPALAGAARRGDRPLPVQVQAAALGRVGRSVRATGTVYPKSEVKIMSQAEGQVMEVLVREGDRVLKGQLLAQLDPTIQRIELALAESELASSQAKLRKLQAGNLPQEIAAAAAAVAQARATLKRSEAEVVSAQAHLEEALANAKSLRELHEKGVISNQEWIKVSTEVHRARADLSERKARIAEDDARVSAAEERLKLVRLGARPEDIAAAKAEVEKMRQQVSLLSVQLEYFSIRAPGPGVITERLIEPGDLAQNRAHLLSMAHVDTLRVQGQVSELDLPRLKKGQKCSVEFDAYPGRRFDGKLARIFPLVDPRTRQATVEVELPNPDGLLRPGFHARLAFAPQLGRETLVLPVYAVEWISSEGQEAGYVYTLGSPPARKKRRAAEGEGGKEPNSGEVLANERPRKGRGGANKLFAARRVRVKLGERAEGMVQVLGGLKAGDKVIVSAVTELRDGSPVLVVGE